MNGYGEPSPAAARGFGRGRIQGRGGRMPGRMPGRAMMARGGRAMTPGRGAMPGGRAMLARGRGGRLMMPGGGRGRRRRRIPSKLDGFNKFVTYKITSHLDRDDQEKLGLAYPQFTPQPLTPQQQKMRMMKKMAEAKNPYGTEANAGDDKEKEDSKTEEKPVENGDKPEMATEPKETSEKDGADEKDDGAADEKMEDSDNKDKPANGEQITPEQRKAMMNKREEMMKINMTDCHTLLGQLNTKRLYRRIKYFKRKFPNYNVDKAYPYGMDTKDVSNAEWEALLEDYKKRLEQKALLEEDVSERKANSKKSKKKKKKKGKGKKGKNKKSNKPKDANEDPVEENPEDDSNQSDAEEEKETGNDQEVKEADKDEDSLSDFVDDESFDAAGFDYIGDKPSKYELLMFTPCPRAVAVLASYPRSGNSLMRNLYEKITLRVTGSDMMGGLQKHDLVGEMATGTNNVQFVKTHYPERMGHPPFRVSRAVLLVRNPYDAMDSYFNLMSTATHTTSLSEEKRKKLSKVFAEMAKKEILVWRDFHEYWLKQKIPLLVVRYEDLIRDTVRVVSHVIRFVLEINSMTFFEDRIHRAIGEEQVEKLGPYKARSGGIGKSLTKGNYTPELLQQINYGIQNTMEKFGYKEMLIPNPKKWRLTPLDQWGVYIPGSSDEPMIINQKGLVRGPNRQTDWRRVKQFMEAEKQKSENKQEVPTKVDLNWKDLLLLQKIITLNLYYL